MPFRFAPLFLALSWVTASAQRSPVVVEPLTKDPRTAPLTTLDALFVIEDIPNLEQMNGTIARIRDLDGDELDDIAVLREESLKWRVDGVSTQGRRRRPDPLGGRPGDR